MKKCMFFLFKLGIMLLTLFLLTSVNVSADTLVSDQDTLNDALTVIGNDTVILSDDISLNKRIDVIGNKIIDLNDYTITLGEDSSDNGKAGKFYLNQPSNESFTIKNGKLTGGDTRGLSSHASIIGVISVGNKANVSLMTTVQDIEHKGKGGFYKGKTSNVTFKGKVTLDDEQFNVRAKNMDFFGNSDNPNDPENVDFYGHTSADGDPHDGGTSDGGLNLSFDGYQAFKGPDQRRLNIPKNAAVKLKNDNNTTSNNRGYANNIANFAVINLDGSLDVEAIGTTLRTTASSSVSGAGTASNQAELNISPGSTFKAQSSATTSTKYGTIFTYSLNINIDNPKIFDIRFFGTGQFFYSWTNRVGSNFSIKNSDIAVWNKDKQGIGNPNDIWPDVEWMTIKDFTYIGTPKAQSSNANLARDFTINNYSRISNDIVLPIIIPDSTFVSKSGDVSVANGDSRFFGSTNYFLPNKTMTGKVAAGATVTLKYHGKTFTTMTDEEGNWSFDHFDANRFPAGLSDGELYLVDKDQRITPTVHFTVKDTLPPIATPKLQRIQQNTTNALTDPKLALDTFSDETTTAANLKVEFITSLEDRQNMLKVPGVYEIDVKVIDEANNATLVKSPVIVFKQTKPVTNAFVSGKDFSIDIDDWTIATPDQKRALILNETYGNAKGYTITNNVVTEVTDDPSKFLVDLGSITTWKPNTTYPIKLTVGTYSDSINMTLTQSTINMRINQIYKTDISRPIYSDLINKKEVDNSRVYAVKKDDVLSELLTQLNDNGSISLNHEGYDTVTSTQYSVYIDGVKVNTTVAPDKNFELRIEYTGQLKLKSVPNLNFGKIKISDKESMHTLTDNSEKNVSIMNTVLNSRWTLKLSIPDGIKKVGTNELYKGDIVYVNGLSNHLIGPTDTAIALQQKEQLVSDISMISTDKKDGMQLKQDLGNTLSSYSADLIWSVVDAPN